MGMYIPYMLVVIYFLGLAAICALVLSRHESSRTVQQLQQARRSSELTKNALSYLLLALVFAFFLVLTFVLQHDTTRHT